jgi:Winged helix DNA-binding domain
MWCGALGALPTSGGQPKGVRLEADETAVVVEAIAAAVAGTELTAEELGEAVRSACGPWACDPLVSAFGGGWPRWRQALGTAAHAGVLCFGPARSRRLTFADPRRWMPELRPAPSDEALPWLLNRYLHDYGPATAAQFAQWVGAPRRFAEDLVTSVASDLQAVDLDGDPAWVNAGDHAFDAEQAQGVRLLPYFDPYVVGSHPRRLVFPGKVADRALTHGQAGTFPVLLVDGDIAGIWHPRRSGRRLHVQVEAFEPLRDIHHAALGTEVDRIGTILEALPELTIGPVTAGAHK